MNLSSATLSPSGNSIQQTASSCPRKRQIAFRPDETDSAYRKDGTVIVLVEGKCARYRRQSLVPRADSTRGTWYLRFLVV